MEQQPKKSNVTTIIIIIVAVLVVLSIGGYFVSNFLARKAGEKLAEGIIEAGTGGNVNVDTSKDKVTISDGNSTTTVGGETGNVAWPKDLPTGVPKYSGGQIKAVSHAEDTKIWSISISETSNSDYEKYKSALTNGGWTSEGENSFLVSMTQVKKGNVQITVSYDDSSKGVLIAVSQE